MIQITYKAIACNIYGEAQYKLKLNMSYLLQHKVRDQTAWCTFIDESLFRQEEEAEAAGEDVCVLSKRLKLCLQSPN